MRQRKFKLWDKKNKRMLYADSDEYVIKLSSAGRGYFAGIGRDEYIVLGFNGTLTMRTRYSGDAEYTNSDVTEDYELLEDTGLKDVNGKAIWEGHICKVKMGNRELVGAMYFNQEKAQFGMDSMLETKQKEIPDHLEIHHKPEIIGNVFENPELLEGNSTQS